MPDLILSLVRPCVKCGATDRYPPDKRGIGRCRPCSHALSADYKAKNWEKCKALSAAWRIANIEKLRVAAAAYHIANAEKKKKAARDWTAANRERSRLQKSDYRARKPEKQIESSARWRAAHPEQAKACIAAWQAANPERVKTNNAAWRAANPEARRISKQNRRAREAGGGGKLSKGLSAKLLKLQKGLCPCCKKLLGDDFHMDHIVPLVLGGTNTDDNMQLLRAECNLQKHVKHPVDFMQSRGFLL